MTGEQNFSNLPEHEDQDMDYIKDKRHTVPIQEIRLTGTSKVEKKILREKVIKGDNFRARCKSSDWKDPPSIH